MNAARRLKLVRIAEKLEEIKAQIEDIRDGSGVRR